jgi:predicted nuclease of predicted toxin-antitoxin system
MSSGYRLLLDENIHEGAVTGLQDLEIDTVHVRSIGLQGKPDNQILDAAIETQRILVTRDIKDYIRIVRFYINSGRQVTGVLLVPSSFQEKEPAQLIRAIQVWIQARDLSAGITGGIAWLSQDILPDGDDRRIREVQPAYVRALRRLEATA